MLVILVLYAATACVAAPLARRLGRDVFWVCAVAPLVTLAWVATQAGEVFDGGTVVSVVEWVPGLGLDLTLLLDGFSLMMVVLIAGIGLAIAAYSARYFSPAKPVGLMASYLTAFAGSMLGVVLSDNLLVLYVFWELTSVTSYLLIAIDDTEEKARKAARQAILITAGGGLAMLAGFVLLGQAAGTFELSAILADPPDTGSVAPALALILVGAFTKSAQVPFHSWLPGAMAAPTPISAYLHSATMVKAGIYLVARLAPAFATDVAFWRPVVMGVGATTMVVGGLRALRQHDLKLLMAHGTVSQLGFMMVLVGAGHPELTFAGAAVILAHGLFKAALFMVVGVVDHQAHTRDLRKLSGLGRAMPITAAVAAVSVASMAGLPPLLGFVAKESALEGLLHGGTTSDSFALVAVVGASVLTFAYGARFLWGAFAAKSGALSDAVGVEAVSPRPSFLAPAAVLAVLTTGLGLVPGVAERLVGPAAASLDAAAAGEHLLLWHGFTPALGLSALTMVLGTGLFLARRNVEVLQGRLGRIPSSADTYAAGITGIERGSRRVTAVVQSGSLPVYLGIAFLTLLALPGIALLVGATWPDGLVLTESALQAAVAALVITAAIGTALSRRRFVAVMFLGAVGYGMAVMFVIQGAPDLALTQLLVETLGLVIFVLVLRHLPSRFETAPWPLGRTVRATLAVGVGVVMAAFTVVSAGVRTAPPVSDLQVAQALPEGGGSNVVNVILTDFRALDTLGEVTVLVIAALGIMNLVTITRRERSARTRKVSDE